MLLEGGCGGQSIKVPKSTDSQARAQHCLELLSDLRCFHSIWQETKKISEIV